MTPQQERLSQYIASLDMMIAAISSDLARQNKKSEKREAEAQIILQMQEALSELHQRRSQARFLLAATSRKRRG